MQGFVYPLPPHGEGDQPSARTQICAVSRAPDRLDVFVIGRDGGIWGAWWHDPGGKGAMWYDWTRATTTFHTPGSPLTVSARDSSHLNVFVVGGAADDPRFDGSVWSCAWDDDTQVWRDTGRIAGARNLFAYATPVATLSRNSKQIDLFAVGPGGYVYTAAWTDDPAVGFNAVGSGSDPGDKWTGWTIIGDVADKGRGVAPCFEARTPIAALSRNSDQMDLFAVGPDGYIRNAWWNGKPWNWGAVDNRPYPQGTPIAAISVDSDHMNLFAVAEDGGIYNTWWNGGPWQSERVTDRTFPERTPIAVVSRNKDQIDIFAVDDSGTVMNAWWHGNRWNYGPVPFDVGKYGPSQLEACTPLAAVCRDSDHMDLFAVWGNMNPGDQMKGEVWNATWNGDWTAWGPIKVSGGWETALVTQPALDGTPEQAFASHRSRAVDNARFFANGPLGELNPQDIAALDDARRSHPNNWMQGRKQATEDDTFTLIAHLHMVSVDPNFNRDGLDSTQKAYPLSRDLANRRIRQLIPGSVGTGYEYDSALKGLITIAHRYRAQLDDSTYDYFLNSLLNGIIGPHDPGVMNFTLVGPTHYAESENHVLMIESSRYLANQLLQKYDKNPKWDNAANGFDDWLIEHLSTFARFDFLEFNARPYSRYTLHALLNLYDFASSLRVKTAVQIILDYLATKFALSSARNRRLGPFRRLMDNINHESTDLDNITRHAIGNDTLSGFFYSYTGLIDRDGDPLAQLHPDWAKIVLISGPSNYRPPPAAYAIAMNTYPPVQHAFYHGKRPKMPTTGASNPEGGYERYYKSTSFLLTAGGIPLASGYADEIVNGYKSASRAQSITLLPTRSLDVAGAPALDPLYRDLIRFEPFPDPWSPPPNENHPIQPLSVNTGIFEGFACGVNLRVPNRWLQLTQSAWDDDGWIFLNLDQQMRGYGRLGLYVAMYRTAVAQPIFMASADGPRLLIVDNVALLHAVEASTVQSFNDFETLTRDRNQLPAALP